MRRRIRRLIRIEGSIPHPLACHDHKGMEPEYKYLMRTTYLVALPQGMLIIPMVYGPPVKSRWKGLALPIREVITRET